MLFRSLFASLTREKPNFVKSHMLSVIPEIGRASGRGRVEISVGAVSLKKKKKEKKKYFGGGFFGGFFPLGGGTKNFREP